MLRKTCFQESHVFIPAIASSGTMLRAVLSWAIYSYLSDWWFSIDPWKDGRSLPVSTFSFCTLVLLAPSQSLFGRRSRAFMFEVDLSASLDPLPGPVLESPASGIWTQMMGEAGADREKRGGTSCIKKGKWATRCRYSCVLNHPFPCSQLHLVYFASMNWEDSGAELQLAHGYYRHPCWAGSAAQGVRWQGGDHTHHGHGAGTPWFGHNAELGKGQRGDRASSRLGESGVIKKGSSVHMQIAGTLTAWIMPLSPLRAFVLLPVRLERIFTHSWV